MRPGEPTPTVASRGAAAASETARSAVASGRAATRRAAPRAGAAAAATAATVAAIVSAGADRHGGDVRDEPEHGELAEVEGEHRRRRE